MYVFCKLWSSTADKRLLAAAILLFIPGVFKCFEKPLALRRSSFYNQVSRPSEKSSSAAESTSLEGCIQAAKTAASPHQANLVYDLIDSQEGRKCLEALSGPDMLFVDVARTYSERARASESFWPLDNDAAQQAIGTGISNTFNLLYTKDFTRARRAWKENQVDLLCSFFTWILCLLVPVAAVGLLHSGRKEAYRGSDVKITFVLLYATLLVDACSILSLDGAPWHGMVTQHNLMELFARNRRRPWVTAVAGHLRCTELLGHRFFFPTEPCDSGRVGITSAVRCHVRDGLNEYIKDAESYTSFGDLRGQWTLQRHKCDASLLSLDRPFDEAVLVWHLATDLYRSLSPDYSTDATLATQISNYMMHLLFANAEMLMPGSRTYLCTAAHRGIEAILDTEEKKPPQEKGRMVADMLLGCLNNHPELSTKTEEDADLEFGKRLVYAAWDLARALHKLPDDRSDATSTKKAWRVVRGVWVEMLCFSAIRCRGYLHAKSLGSGGEYLTFVWLIMAHAGLETFPERQQRFRTPPLPPRSDQSAAATDEEPLPPPVAAAHSSAGLQN